MIEGRRRSARSRFISPITRRILAVNILALVFLAAGMLYLADYRRGLIVADLAALRTQAELFAAALGEGATRAEAGSGESFVPQVTQQMLRRLVEASGARARLFGVDGALLADSRLLVGPGGRVQIRELPPPPSGKERLSALLNTFERLMGRLFAGEVPPLYEERREAVAGNFPEVMDALSGDIADEVRALADGGLLLSVAAPVQRYKQVLGALMLSKTSRDIDAAVFKVRLAILEVFAVTLVVTVLLSLYLAGTIARPLLKLAAAAERVRRDPGREHTIPDFGNRRDEIGELAAVLREMTEALRQRMDAIEGFAADVAHEIKNPLTSLKSAVETARRVNDPERRNKLLAIVEDDVHRLDRLISDISDASRLDAELSRAKAAPVDVGQMLTTIVDVTQTAAAQRGVHLRLEHGENHDLVVQGLEGRLVQVFRNLIANAVSFSPPEGTITLRARRVGESVMVEVIDEGPGIPTGKEKAIFDRFYTERPHGEKFGTHSGLGLSISKQIVEAHRGTVRAENRHAGAGDDGRVIGARFVVMLPAA